MGNSKDPVLSQGQINAKVVLLRDDPEKLVEFTDTLTKDQRNKARSHLQTVLKIEQNNRERERAELQRKDSRHLQSR